MPVHHTLVIQSKSPRTAENTAKKALHKIFNKWGFKITIDAGLIRTDFLDVELNLTNKHTFHLENEFEYPICE